MFFILFPDDINEDTRIVMINALYFKSFWLNKFDTHATTTQDFHNVNRKVKRVSMMFKNSNFSHGILKELNARVLEIPYKVKPSFYTDHKPSSFHSMITQFLKRMLPIPYKIKKILYLKIFNL